MVFRSAYKYISMVPYRWIMVYNEFSGVHTWMPAPPPESLPAISSDVLGGLTCYRQDMRLGRYFQREGHVGLD